MGWCTSHIKVETQHGDNTIIRSLTNGNGCLVKEQDEMCESLYKHFAELFGRNKMLDYGEALKDFLADGLHLSA